jgi:DNA-binding transcriptional regulator YdaS (Cro superfamily)
MNPTAIINILGGATKVAKLCNVSVPAVSMWQKSDIPKDKLIFLAATLERETNGLITRKALFPETYAVIWPELQFKR